MKWFTICVIVLLILKDCNSKWALQCSTCVIKKMPIRSGQEIPFASLSCNTFLLWRPKRLYNKQNKVTFRSRLKTLIGKYSPLVLHCLKDVLLMWKLTRWLDSSLPLFQPYTPVVFLLCTCSYWWQMKSPQNGTMASNKQEYISQILFVKEKRPDSKKDSFWLLIIKEISF